MIGEGGQTSTALDTSMTTKLQALVQSRVFMAIMRISRIVLYVFGVWTFFIYFWSVLGILIGIGVAALSKNLAWRRHGYILAYSSSIYTGAMAVYAWLVLLVIILFLITYLLGTFMLVIIRLTITGIRRIL